MKKLWYCFALCTAAHLQSTSIVKRVPGGVTKKSPTGSILSETSVTRIDDGEDFDGDLFFDAAPITPAPGPVVNLLKAAPSAPVVVTGRVESEYFPAENTEPAILPAPAKIPVVNPKEHAAAFDTAVAAASHPTIPQFRKRSDSDASTETAASSVSFASETPKIDAPVTPLPTSKKKQLLGKLKSALLAPLVHEKEGPAISFPSLPKRTDDLLTQKKTTWERLKESARERQKLEDDALEREKEWEENKPELLKKIDRKIQQAKDFRDGDLAMRWIRFKQKTLGLSS